MTGSCKREASVDEALEQLACDPAPERRLEAIRLALRGWRVGDEARRDALDGFMLRVAQSLDFFARVELADMLAGFGDAPLSLEGLLTADPSTEAVLAGIVTEGRQEVGPTPSRIQVTSTELAVEIAMSGAFEDLAQALARRSARPLGLVQSILAEGDAERLGTLVRHAGYGRMLLAAIATGQERHGRQPDLLTMMIAYEMARPEPAPMKAQAR